MRQHKRSFIPGGVAGSFLAAAVLLTVVLAGGVPAWAADAAERTWYTPPVDISVEGHRFDDLFLLVTAMLTFLVLGMTGILVISMTVFRARPGRKALYDHGGSRRDVLIEIAISTAIFLIVDGTLLVRSHINMNDVFWRMPDANAEQVLRVEIMPQQWVWNVRYPGLDGVFNTEDDVVTLNDLRVPTGTKVHVQLKSKDVIHSLFLPNVRLKQDANPEELSEFWFETRIPGEYEMVCAEMCGFAHYQMRGDLRVYPPADFEKWYREASAWARVGYDPAQLEQQWGWEWKEL